MRGGKAIESETIRLVRIATWAYDSAMKAWKLCVAIFYLGLALGCSALPRYAIRKDEHPIRVGRIVAFVEGRRQHEAIHAAESVCEEVAETLELPNVNEPIYVRVFDDEAEYERFVAERYPSMRGRRAFFTKGEAGLQVFALRSPRLVEDLRHEIAHACLHSTTCGLPLWLDEGLAEYFELRQAKGAVHDRHLALLHDAVVGSRWRPDLTRLEQLDSPGAMLQLDYAEAWLWVHGLLHGDASTRRKFLSYIADAASYRGDLSKRLKPDFAAGDVAVRHLQSLNERSAR